MSAGRPRGVPGAARTALCFWLEVNTARCNSIGSRLNRMTLASSNSSNESWSVEVELPLLRNLECLEFVSRLVTAAQCREQQSKVHKLGRCVR